MNAKEESLMSMVQRKPRLYLAAPLFSPTEREFNLGLKTILAPAFDVYLPQEDGELLIELESEGMDHALAARTVFQADVNAIDRCDLVLMVLDGRAVDEGAAFEVGYANGLGKPCFGLQTDNRRLLGAYNNPMLECALAHVFNSVDQLAAWVREQRFGANVRLPGIGSTEVKT